MSKYPIIIDDSDNDEFHKLQEKQKVVNQLSYINKTGNKLEDSIRNGVDIKLMMEWENNGLGNMTLSEILNVLQDMRQKGSTNLFPALCDRRKPVIEDKTMKELQYYRATLEKMKGEFLKKRKGSDYRLWAETIDSVFENVDKGKI
ncbi:hypothetical protein NDS46_31430 (plasmid) [Paenibacillus thiaminolyticus]|uniref:hypothetical protein n=1 Tax=Paenibacillus thiaminolyticus TaxID=49283 RepID=UPI00232A86C0|nr:hypothetical protein [Paenibacillus thiaminolyticus]WCF11471.1 hypothetical protein NDS46_31430 [Paenibacillus thiaminolyticus]